ncbi:alpha/beta hydrolase [Pseudomonas sp. GOM7]|uniref:alpha/beta hydrolase n=1 Tax=unclassified Pseudomonas TaxID=196821 RepID=UPI00227B9ACE|nr:MULTISPECIES: alpha/beta hydrolase [unclassified Pseudomonas]WAJ36454.1 alpha/beta hydrolase [Pseudomonas sp. GOM7]
MASRLRALSLLIVSLWLGGCSGLLFYPEPGLPFTPERAGLEYRDIELRAADGTRLHAWWLPAKPGVAVKGTVLHLHGNGGNLAWHLGGTYWLPEQGYQVLMLDYRGYGLSEGVPRLPAVYQDIDAAFAWLDQAPETQGKPLTLLGQSLGGALAVHYLALHPERRARLHGLVLDGVPASYRDVARDVLSQSWLTWPLQVPLSWLVPDGDSAIASIAQLEPLPLLIFHSLDDEVVAFSNGERLNQAARSPRRFIETRGGHVQTFAEDAWRQVLLTFLQDPLALVDSPIPPASVSETSQ